MRYNFLYIVVVGLIAMMTISCNKEPVQQSGVLEIPVESVALSKNQLLMNVNDTYGLNVIVSPDDATNIEVIWECDNEEVAVVSEEGIVTALKAGSVTITATSKDNNALNDKCYIDIFDISSLIIANVFNIQPSSATISISSEDSADKPISFYYSDSYSTFVDMWSDGECISSSSFDKKGLCSFRLESLTPFTKYYFCIFTEENGIEITSEVMSFVTSDSTIPIFEPSAVDLGLSVKWASCNLGASKPSERGAYYQWAGTTDVSDTNIYLDFNNCPYHTGSERLKCWTKYNAIGSMHGIVDNKRTLEPIDDAATVVLGEKWRLPTEAEYIELKNSDNCSWTLIKIDGVNGYKVQSLKPGYRDNWIFFPFYGYRDGGQIKYSDLGYYWSSSVASMFLLFPSDAYYLELNMENSYSVAYRSRYEGMLVRPVTE